MSGTNSAPGREQRLCSIHEGLSLLFRKEENRHQRALAALWQNWGMILGEELSAIALPLGHKKDTLIIGAEDNMSMQELSMQHAEILERVNAFMDCGFFRHVRVMLLLGQRPLNTARRPPLIAPLRMSVPPKPPRLGGLQGKLDPDSPVSRCYEAYLALFKSP